MQVLEQEDVISKYGMLPTKWHLLTGKPVDGTSHKHEASHSSPQFLVIQSTYQSGAPQIADMSIC